MSKFLRGIFLAAGWAFILPTLLAEGEKPSPPEQSREEIRKVMLKYREVSRRINADPAVAVLHSKLEEARRNYREAFKTAMEKEDPGLLKEYEVIRQFQMSGRQQPWNGMPSQRSTPDNYSHLTEAEKKQLDAARREAMQSAVVKDARIKRNEAKDEEQRSNAVKAYREVLHKAMIEADKEVEDLLKKLEGSK